MLHDPIYNKGSSFFHPERDRLNLRGLVPPRRLRTSDQEALVMEEYEKGWLNIA